MRFIDIQLYREHWFSVGRDTLTGAYYLAFPVSNRLVDYEEYYAIPEHWALRSGSYLKELKVFANECRRQQHDDLLLVQPGSDRGTTSCV